MTVSAESTDKENSVFACPSDPTTACRGLIFSKKMCSAVTNQMSTWIDKCHDVMSCPFLSLPFLPHPPTHYRIVSLVSRQPSAVSRQPSAVSRQPSAVSRQPSVFTRCQPSTPAVWNSIAPSRAARLVTGLVTRGLDVLPSPPPRLQLTRRGQTPRGGIDEQDGLGLTAGQDRGRQPLPLALPRRHVRTAGHLVCDGNAD